MLWSSTPPRPVSRKFSHGGGADQRRSVCVLLRRRGEADAGADDAEDQEKYAPLEEGETFIHVIPDDAESDAERETDAERDEAALLAAALVFADDFAAVRAARGVAGDLLLAGRAFDEIGHHKAPSVGHDSGFCSSRVRAARYLAAGREDPRHPLPRFLFAVAGPLMSVNVRRRPYPSVLVRACPCFPCQSVSVRITRAPARP